MRPPERATPFPLPMDLRQANDSVAPSALAERIKELHRQGLRYRADLEQICRELELLQEKILHIGAGPTPKAGADGKAGAETGGER